MDTETNHHPARGSLIVAAISSGVGIMGTMGLFDPYGPFLIFLLAGFVGSLVGLCGAFIPLWRRDLRWRSRLMASGTGILANSPMLLLGLATPMIISQNIADGYRHYDRFDGKSLYTSVYAASLEDDFASFPSSILDTSATAYLKRIQRHGVIAATPDFVSSFRQPSADSWETLRPETVGWCFVADLKNHAPADSPFAFSANLTATNTAQLVGRIGDSLDPDHPSGQTRLIAIRHGGGATIHKSTETWESILPPDFLETPRPILQP